MNIRIGIIGTGYMAAAILPSIRLAGATAYGVSSRDKARADAFVAANGLNRAYTNAEDMLRDEMIGAVYVASATGAHGADSIAALEAGKHVLCEKPFAMTAEEGERVIAAAKASGRLFMEALWTHFLPAYERVYAIARGDSLGTPKHLSAAYGFPASPALRPRLFEKHDGGAILDLGVYPVSLALRLLGPAKAADATVMRNADGVDTHVAVRLLHENGAVSQLAASFDALMSNMATLSCSGGAATISAPLFGAEEVVIERAAPAPAGGGASGLKAALKKNPMLRRLKRAAGGGGEHHPYGADQYLPQMKHFLGLIGAGKTESPVASFALSLETARILNRVRESR